jgi:hypothetical protein
MVGPASGVTIPGEPTLLRKLQVAKEAAWSPTMDNMVGSRLQEIAEGVDQVMDSKCGRRYG